MYITHDRQPPMPPPLSMDPPPQLGQNGPSYSTQHPAASSLLPSIPRSPQDLGPSETVVDGRKYSLEIVQQPVRARMCGFGDKDRRPITPPPCIRLVVTDVKDPNQPIDISEIDTSFFVLTVDLWSAEGNREVNLVRHSQTSPSISAATSASYPPPTQPPPQPPTNPYAHGFGFQIASAYGPPPPSVQAQQGYYHPNAAAYHPGLYQQPPQNPYQQALPPPQLSSHQAYYPTTAVTPLTPAAFYSNHMQAPASLMSPQHFPPTISDPRTGNPSGMFTRNLIGSLGVSAFKLTDVNNELGIWFILQDLSVRTEGTFRLKMNFVDVGSTEKQQSLNSGSAPVLASCFSEVFQVFSAKKFPGVIESTHLSKCFATQGIKIPIRKDGPRGNVRDRDEDED
ncbi:MAG: hypothetical protein LQ351_005804 [Letrouitia transgressa]|nr:MAG: hypothetical protein LQ351_005804 [Letrouitia transgressa]